MREGYYAKNKIDSKDIFLPPPGKDVRYKVSGGNAGGHHDGKNTYHVEWKHFHSAIDWDNNKIPSHALQFSIDLKIQKRISVPLKRLRLFPRGNK